jgi:predicted dehydrogenase
MGTRSNRRDFLKQSAITGAGLWLGAGRAPADPRSPNEKLNIACIGVGGRGEADMMACAGENIVALCDIDDQSLGKAASRFPQARQYSDFRRLLEQKDVEAVVIATPDHTHAAAANMAMKLGKHVYCEKPLTHTVYEARVLTQTAAAQKVATQMGNQGHSNDGVRRVVELVRAGAIGPVREVHAWTDRPGTFWPQGIDRPAAEPVPKSVHWDLWLGPAPERPYSAAYHPFKWRGFWDFGTGALGDMACHVLDPAFWALQLGAPVAVEASGAPRKPESGPSWEILRFEFPARGEMPSLTLTWYDGGKKPSPERVFGEKLPANGSIFVGDRGVMLLPDPYGDRYRLLPAAKFADYAPPPKTIPSSPGHHAEWILACKTGSPTGSNFGYAGPFTEAVLLGNVAFRCGQPIQWDAAGMKVTNCPDAEAILQPPARPGWSLE